MRAVQTNLTAGEISRQAAARHELEFRQSAAAHIENAFVMIEGGVTRTPGTEKIALCKSNTKRARLIVFKKSNEDIVIIEAGENYFRYFDGITGAPLMSGGSVIETATPWNLDGLDNLYWFQSADVMFFTCKNGLYQPRILRRFADDDWSLIAYDAKEGPFLPEDQGSIILTPSAATGSISLSGAAGFAAGHVGARYRLWTDYNAIPYKKWQAEETGLTIGMRRVHEGRVYLVTASGDGTNSPPVHEKGSASDGGSVIWLYEHDLAGVVKITAFTSSSLVTAAVESQLPDVAGSPSTRIWAEGFFSNQRGWPFVGGLFGSRLFYAGAPQFPDTIWMTRIDGYGLTYADFKQSAGGGEVLDDHAVVRTLNDGEVQRIAWAITGEQIMLGHAGGVVRVSGPSIQEPITPSGASAIRPEPPPGAYFGARAVRAGQRIVYASTSGRKIIGLDPDDFSYQTLTARARNKGSARFKEFAYASETVYRLFALREDGRCFACAFDAEQKVVGWSTMTPAGSYAGAAPLMDSIAVAPDAGGRDRLWCIMVRTINGATKRTIERMALDFDSEEMLADEAVMGDGAVIVDNWNADPAKTVKITKVGGGPALRDDVVTLSASGFTFNASWVGKEIRVRRKHAPPLASDVDGEAAALVTAQAGATATATLLSDCPSGIYNSACDQWAQATAAVSGLDHLEGESVGVWADGVDLGDFTVASGAINLGADLSARIVAGLRKAWRVTSLPFVLLLRDGVSKGQVLSVTRGYVDLLDAEAAGVTVTAIAENSRRESEILGGRDDDDLVTVVAGLRSGLHATPLPAGRARSMQIEIGGSGMGPASVLTMGVEYGP